NGPGEAADFAAPDPAAHARARDVRAHLALYLAERHRATGGGAGADADQPLSLGCASRGRAPEAGVSGDGSRCEEGLLAMEMWFQLPQGKSHDGFYDILDHVVALLQRRGRVT